MIALANLPPNLSQHAPAHDPYSLPFRCWPGNVRAHYNLNAANALVVGTTLHDLNTVEARTPAAADVESIGNADEGDGGGDAAADSLDNEEESPSEDCVAQEYENLQPVDGVDAVDGVDTEQQINLENDESSTPAFGVLTYSDVVPIEAARARFVQLIIDRFIQPRSYPVSDSPEGNYSNPNSKEKESKRKPSEVHYEGDPRFLLPLTFVANLYETLISEIDARLHTVEGVHEKTMGVALEASGGLYRKLVKKFPKSGHPVSFKRREMASALEAKTKFPQLVRGDEKRVRFVVVHGLELIERPEMPQEDAEWFKRLTGRQEAAVTGSDYNFYSARVKHRRLTVRDPPPVPQQYQAGESPSVITPHSPTRDHPQIQMQQSRVRHQVQQPSQTHTPRTPPHVSRDIQSGIHPGMTVMVPPPSPAKFCDQCGAPFLRETSRFCTDCGNKRHGVP
ncbi:hypothetical protein SELMODRAFT_414814 [Selaginella moellendorffii]|uniref:Uncharacterized protein n=1 Tax=Selaginella moellendorffii TaxID=88036 RepID=D8RUQ4_SELML|nr:hypothetical protein SELMODRAFT_414814 [Selaginella moellendorffii]